MTRSSSHKPSTSGSKSSEGQRRARNRVNAKRSRERKTEYIRTLEERLRAANERIAELENQLACGMYTDPTLMMGYD